MAAASPIGPAQAVEESTDASLAAVQALYERYASQIFGFCFRELRSRVEAEDAVQITFLNAIVALRHGVVPRHERAWLYAIAQNVCRTGFSLRAPNETPTDPDDLSSIPAPPRHADELIQLDEALAQMTQAQRTAILLREWHGLSYNEVAERMGLSHAAVETLIFRARHALAAGLGGPRVQPLRRLASRFEVGSVLAGLKSFLSGAAAVKAGMTAVAVTTVTIAAAPGLERQFRLVLPPRAAPRHASTETSRRPVPPPRPQARHTAPRPIGATAQARAQTRVRTSSIGLAAIRVAPAVVPARPPSRVRPTRPSRPPPPAWSAAVATPVSASAAVATPVSASASAGHVPIPATHIRHAPPEAAPPSRPVRATHLAGIAASDPSAPAAEPPGAPAAEPPAPTAPAPPAEAPPAPAPAPAPAQPGGEASLPPVQPTPPAAAPAPAPTTGQSAPVVAPAPVAAAPSAPGMQVPALQPASVPRVVAPVQKQHEQKQRGEHESDENRSGHDRAREKTRPAEAPAPPAPTATVAQPPPPAQPAANAAQPAAPVAPVAPPAATAEPPPPQPAPTQPAPTQPASTLPAPAPPTPAQPTPAAATPPAPGPIDQGDHHGGNDQSESRNTAPSEDGTSHRSDHSHGGNDQ